MQGEPAPPVHSMIIIRRECNQRLSVSSSSIGRRECITDDTLRVTLEPLVSRSVSQAATSCCQKDKSSQSEKNKKIKQNRDGHSEESRLSRGDGKHHVTSQTNSSPHWEVANSRRRQCEHACGLRFWEVTCCVR